MKAISRYAHTHAVQARIFITVAQVLIFAMAMYLGAALDHLSITLPTITIVVFAGIAGAAVFGYLFFKNHYARRYAALFTFGTAIFFALVFNYNNNRVNQFQTCTLTYGVKEVKPAVSSKEQRKQARKALLHLLKDAKKKKASAEQVVGIIIVLLISIGLLSLVAAASCSLACNGAEGLAYLVALAGTTGVVLLAIWGIRKVTGHKKKPGKARKDSAE